jgi:hypothetical protein
MPDCLVWNGHGIRGPGVACRCLLRALWLAHPWRPNLWHLAPFLSEVKLKPAMPDEGAPAMISDLFGDDTLRRQGRDRLVKRELFGATGISSVRRGTGPTRHAVR